MFFFDSHAHLTDLEAYSDIDEVIQRAKRANVVKIINICSSPDSLEKGLLLSKKYDFIYTAAASDPHSVEKNGEEFLPVVERAALNKNIMAVGETGLDYFYEHSKRQTQKDFLIKHLLLAKKNDLRAIIHCRNAFLDLFQITDEYYRGQKALVHCFTGNEQEAKEVLKRGWFLSFSGIITYSNSGNLRNVLKNIPLDKILIETDSPLLSPQSKRGKKNEPANLVETAQCLARVKNISLEEAANKTYDNAMRCFSLE